MKSAEKKRVQYEIAHSIDITAEVCPMTFVRTKLALERLKAGEIIEVRLKGAEPLENVPRAARDHGHAVLALAPEGKGAGKEAVHRLLIRKN